MDELLGRVMPYSAEAEQSVLGAMLIDPNCVGDVLGQVKAPDFHIDANREIFETIFSMFSYSQTIDPITVLDQMRVRGVYKEGVSKGYILELIQVTPTSANVLEYASIVKDRALLRRLADVAAEITAMTAQGSGEAEKVLEAAERKIYALRQDRNVSGLMPVSQIVQDVYSQLSQAAMSGETMPGLPTGLNDLDRKILGLSKGELVLIASRPGMGKTSIALNIALHVAKQSGLAVAVFNLEMSKEQLVTRMLSGEGGIDSQKLLTGRLSNDEWRRLGVAASEISSTNILIDDNSTLSVADMNAQCRRVKNLGLVVIDYLQLMQSAGGSRGYANENRQQVVSDMSRMLKIMAKELNVPVVCLSQLSRANESRTNKRPMLSDLRESGAIEQDADVVIGLYREGYYDPECETPNLAEALVLKNRHGEIGTINLTWLPEFTSYVNAEQMRDDDGY